MEFHSLTNTSNCTSSDASYYYLDAVCVSTDSLQCNVPTNVNNQKSSLPEFLIYPNPFVSIVNIDFQKLNKPYDVEIYNSFGQIVYGKQKINSSPTSIDIGDITDGVLLIKILYDNQFFYYKLLKQ